MPKVCESVKSDTLCLIEARVDAHKGGKMYLHFLFDIQGGIRVGSIRLIYDESRAGS